MLRIVFLNIRSINKKKCLLYGVLWSLSSRLQTSFPLSILLPSSLLQFANRANVINVNYCLYRTSVHSQTEVNTYVYFKDVQFTFGCAHYRYWMRLKCLALHFLGPRPFYQYLCLFFQQIANHWANSSHKTGRNRGANVILHKLKMVSCSILHLLGRHG